MNADWTKLAAAAAAIGGAGYLLHALREPPPIHKLRDWWTEHVTLLLLNLVDAVQEEDFDTAMVVAEALDIAYGRATLCHWAIVRPAEAVEVVRLNDGDA